MWLRKHNSFTADDMAANIACAFTHRSGRPTAVEHWNNVANVSGWLDPYVMPFRNVMDYRQFNLEPVYDNRGEVVNVRLTARECDGDQEGSAYTFKTITGHVTDERGLVFRTADADNWEDLEATVPWSMHDVPPAQLGERLTPAAVRDANAFFDTCVQQRRLPATAHAWLREQVAALAATDDLPFDWPGKDLAPVLFRGPGCCPRQGRSCPTTISRPTTTPIKSNSRASCLRRA